MDSWFMVQCRTYFNNQLFLLKASSFLKPSTTCPRLIPLNQQDIPNSKAWHEAKARCHPSFVYASQVHRTSYKWTFLSDRVRSSGSERRRGCAESSGACEYGATFSDERPHIFDKRSSGRMVDDKVMNLPPDAFGRMKAPAGTWASCIRIIDPVQVCSSCCHYFGRYSPVNLGQNCDKHSIGQ